MKLTPDTLLIFAGLWIVLCVVFAALLEIFTWLFGLG
jgi:uncharacterized membrane protein SirB2